VIDTVLTPYKWTELCNLIRVPAFIVDIDTLASNGKILSEIQHETGVSILLAQKAFSLWKSYPELTPFLSGTSASSLNEALLAKNHFPGEIHTYSPAFSESELSEILNLSDKTVFNSMNQLIRFEPLWKSSNSSIGIRINPNRSLVEHTAFDPCGEGSRFGITKEKLPRILPDGVEGFHIHGLCGASAVQFEKMIDTIEQQFHHWFDQLKWINFGGGVRITSTNFDRSYFIKTLYRFSQRWPHLAVYLEPGEAVSHQCGVLIASVLDIVENGEQIAVLDISAVAHLPDTLAFDYQPTVINSTRSGHEYHLMGKSCLAGDSIGRYSFDTPLSVGDRIIFGDMAGYSMVKTNMFNGLEHPSIYLRKQGTLERVRSFSYEDFKNRLS